MSHFPDMEMVEADHLVDKSEEAIQPLRAEETPVIHMQNMPLSLLSRVTLAQENSPGLGAVSSHPKSLGSPFKDTRKDQPLRSDLGTNHNVVHGTLTPPTSPSGHDEAFDKLSGAWFGTSTTSEPEWSQISSMPLLENLIGKRSEAEARIKGCPYDPENWLNLTNVYFELGFSDLQVSSAYKALLLIKFALDANDNTLGRGVRQFVARRLSFSCTPGIAAIYNDFRCRRLEAFKALLRGLLDACSYWDGLKVAKEALEFFPDHEHLLILQALHKEEFSDRATILQSSEEISKDIRYLTRVGRSYKRKYPWLAEKLFIRTPELLEEFNKGFNSANCEVQKADFGTSSNPGTSNDVGPLGVFAVRDVRKDEILLVDHNISVIANTPPNKHDYCDACHASLCPLFVPENKKVFPTCCKDVAYCSKKCRSNAINGYHKVMCGKDFQWLYDAAKGKVLDPSWRPLILLRTFAIIITDIRRSPKKKIHPLQHPLVARLMTGYTARIDAAELEWNYFPLVEAPNRILTQLGVDIFADPDWSAEVIHTILWRILNNACRAASVIVEGDMLEKSYLTGIGPGYIFFNHSCDPNVNWMSAGSPEGVARTTEGLEKAVEDGLWAAKTDMAPVKVGSNALLCIATRDIKKGEEARISYLPPAHREQLSRWFEGGCGCGSCEKA